MPNPVHNFPARALPIGLPIGIVAHHQRLQHANKLIEILAPEVISVDDRNRGAEWNHKQILLWMMEGDQEWSIILEDDAVPVTNFRYQLDLALPWAPTPFVGLYLGRGRPPHWQAAISHTIAKDVCWLRCPVLHNAVGYVVKTKLIPSIVHSLRKTWKKEPRLPIDESLTRWGQENKIEFCYTRPSLIDHLDIAPVQKHSYGQPTQKRKAWLVGERDFWDSSTASLEYVPSW